MSNNLNNQLNKDSSEESVNALSKVQPKLQSKIQPKIKSTLQPKLLNSENTTNNDKLPEEVQSKMENSFGEDFSDVNIHKDSGNAEDIGAKAYAQGKDVHFAPGEFQPNTKSGQELIGHELTHVVQQKQGKVEGGDVHGKDMVNSDPSLEKEADDAGKLASEGKDVTIKLSSSAGGNGNPIQRFEAPGHEAAERKALAGDGQFSNDEASMVYYGNWMRDMNQALVPSLADSLSPDIVFLVINFLGFKKFGRYMNAEEFGYYIPSEHIDNPAGQLAGVDYYNGQAAVHSDNQKNKDRFNTSSWNARPDAVKTNQDNNDPVSGKIMGKDLFSVDDSGVMGHIRRTNLHVEHRLEYAAQKGRTPEGMMHFGAAMHAVEDLFAHSNYVEIALDKLLKEDASLLPDLEPENRYVKKMAPTVDNKLTKTAGDTMPVLTTGTFTGLDTMESVGAEGTKMLREGLGDVKTEAEKAAQSELMDNLIRSIDSNQHLKKQVVDSVFAPLIPKALRASVLPQLYKAPLYKAYSIMKMIPAIPMPFNFDDIKRMIRNFINNNVLKPAAEQIEAHLLISKVQDTPLYRAEQENNNVIKSGGKTNNPVKEINAAITGKKPDYATELKEANARKQLYDKTPEKVMAGASHSQLAKDHSNSIFFGLAFHLAVEADKMLRDEMLKFWGTNKVTDPDAAMLSKDPKTLSKDEKNKQEFVKQRTADQNKSLAFGNTVYKNGHADGQEYNLQEMRDHAADEIWEVADTLNTIETTPIMFNGVLSNVKKQVGKIEVNSPTKKLLESGVSTTIQANNYVMTQNAGIQIGQVRDEFYRASILVRKAKTLEEREKAYLQLKLARDYYVAWVGMIMKAKDPKYSAYGLPFYMSFAFVIDKQMAAVAPAYTTEQINLLSDNANPLKRESIALPSITGNKYESLLAKSRQIINHPYTNSWWKAHVRQFIIDHPQQIKEEIRARNSGYVHFDGGHE